MPSDSANVDVAATRHLRRLLATASLVALGGTTALGDITYTLQFDPASSPEAQQVANSVAVAAGFYNQHGSFNKHWNVYHNPGIPTAEANYSGYMGYGGTRNERVAFHEAAHTFGMGTGPGYSGLIAGGLWAGQHGNQAQFETYNTYGDGLHGDGHAIWPAGFNYDNEDGFIQRHWHTRIMAAIRADMGILSFTREAKHELVHNGETAEFSVVSPVAATYQWQKNGVALANGGDVSGANSPTLRIANAEATDEGSYRCAVTGASETLFSRPRDLSVDATQQLGNWAFNGNVSDSSPNGNGGTAFGSPAYTTGMIGQAIDLDGADDYVELPTAAVQASEITVATWVHWDGGSNWQRIFDFGNNTHQYLFLTPQSGSGMRLALRDAVNGTNTEYQINVPALATGQWVHLAAVLNGNYATLYVNGKVAGTTTGIPLAPSNFRPTRNYIGKSQFADPLFNGRVDDFRIYNHALNGAEIWNLWGQSANSAPVFSAAAIDLPSATVAAAYSGQSLATFASDANSDTLTFSKLAGPAWLNVAANGALSGTPGSNDLGSNSCIVRVTDPMGASSDAEVRIAVGFSSTSPVAYWTFEQGTANAYVPYSPVTSGQYDGSMIDTSGNGIHLSAWAASWAWYRPLTPAPTTPQTGNANSLSVQNANSYPALSAIGTGLTKWSPSAWTIEAAIRPDNAANGYQTIVGRDSQGAFAGNTALAALYFSLTPNGALRVLFTDAAGNNWNLESAANAVENLKWQAIAATSNGSTVSLYLKNITDGDPNYMLLGTLNISASTNPAISTGSGDGTSWDPGVITIGRGLYNGGHTDRFFGHLDDIRLHGRALNTTEFLYSTPDVLTPPAAPTGLIASAGNGSVSLNWADNTEPDLASYTVYRSTTNGSGHASIASGLTASAYTDNTATNGTTYYYVVKAVNPDGESPASAQASATPQGLNPPPTPWTTADIGPVGLAGSAGFDAGTYTVVGSGVDIWDTQDSFHYVSQTLTGDGEIRARVTSLTNTDPWAKAGVMIRDGSGAGAANAYMMSTAGNGFSFQWRAVASGVSNSTVAAGNPNPNNWVRLVRSGNLFTGYRSADGVTWTLQTTATVTMGSSVSVGLAVTSHNNSQLNTATFDNVSVTPYPSPWLKMDIGTTGLAGASEFFGGAHTVKGAGAFGGTADGFRYVYQTLSGDGSIVARVGTLNDTGTNARVGIMMRDTLAANARTAALTVTGSGAWRWQRRTTTGGSVTTTNSSSGTAPNLWVRLVRSGNTITASRSTNGTSWTTIGSATVTMASNCYIGLAVASGSTTTLNSSVMDSLIVVP
ncbi:MAG: LamG-like jellyroll fold domain-containing protein [Verrucomicrobiota bacterium]